MHVTTVIFGYYTFLHLKNKKCIDSSVGIFNYLFNYF